MRHRASAASKRILRTGLGKNAGAGTRLRCDMPAVRSVDMDTRRLDMVPAADLKIGMYVEKLDRPWTDTPFLFQGFFIHRQDELETLRRYCQYVFVDRMRTRDGEGHSALAAIRETERTFTPVADVH